MRKQFLIICILLILLINTISAVGNQNGKVEEEDFSVKIIDTEQYINFESNLADIEEILGKQLNEDNDQELTRIWDGLKIELHHKRIYSSEKKAFIKLPNEYIIKTITVTDNSFTTMRGISIGDESEKLLELYGIPFTKTSKIYVYYHNAPEDVWNLVFYLKDNKVEEIKITRGD